MAAVRSLQRPDPQSLIQVFGRRLPVSGAVGAAVVLLVLAAVGAVASAGAVRVTTGPVSPFDAYTPIMPGQPLSALEAFDCGTAFPHDSSTAAFYCMIRPKDGPIRSISVSGRHGKVASLTMRASDVRVGDLIAHWGHPDLRRVFNRSFSMAWNEGIYVMGSLRGRFSYWSSATYVLMMSPDD